MYKYTNLIHEIKRHFLISKFKNTTKQNQPYIILILFIYCKLLIFYITSWNYKSIFVWNSVSFVEVNDFSKCNCFLITVTGNANFNMQRTSFTFFGFTQPYTALPVIEDASNNAKGFTSRILWFFPEPVFSKMRETILTPSECVVVETFKGHLGNYILIVFYDQFLGLQYLFYNFITSIVSLIKTVIVINTTLVQSSDKVWWQNESKKNKQFSISFTLHKFSINFFLEME